MEPAQQNFRVQLFITIVSVLLFITKIVAYYCTNSLAILTDALESIVNVLAGFIGLYSLYVAAKPKDSDHPYGHGKAEFVSAAVEGTLIIAAGILILVQAVQHLIWPHPLKQLDMGLWLVTATAVVNYIAGYVCITIGKRNQSMALQASGKHLQVDSYSTFAIIAGLALLIWLHYSWIDTLVAMCVAILVLYNGYRIVRSSLAGIMDEADDRLLLQLIAQLNDVRRENWIDLHNLRIIKYGSTLHIDCHLTVPWYLTVHEAHAEIDAFSNIIQRKFGNTLESFIHTDGCMPYSCGICTKNNCAERQQHFEKKIVWTLDNIISNQKHRLIN